MLGGGMRQAGVLGAAALYALEHQRARVVQDHEHAALLAREIADIPGILLASERVETNIVMVETVADTAEAIAERLARAGVLAAPVDRRALRFVTHLDVDRDDILEAARRIRATLARPTS
jgi:threonine aldolase